MSKNAKSEKSEKMGAENAQEKSQNRKIQKRRF